MGSFGVDIGGSHITTALVNKNECRIVKTSYVRFPVDSHASAEEILSQWVHSIKTSVMKSATSIEFLGLAVPGPFDYQNGISLMQNVAKYENLYGVNVRHELSSRLDINPNIIQFRNDAEAFLEGEMLFGAGLGFNKGIGLTLGTGLGTSAFENKKAKDMELGMNHPLHSGVAEDYISTRWFISRYLQLSGRTIEGVKELTSLYETDSVTQLIFNEFRNNISQFIKEFVIKFHPEVIIIGGNITAASNLFFPEIEKQLTSLSQDKKSLIVLKKSLLGEDAALMGSVAF